MATRARRAGRPPKEISEAALRSLIFRTFGHQRFTQDSPILPDVWMAYANADEDVRRDLILTPRTGHMPGAVAAQLESRLAEYHGHGGPSDEPSSHRETALIAYNRSSVVAKLTFKELIRVLVPMTSWWRALPPEYRNFDAVEQRFSRFRDKGVDLKTILNTSEEWEYFRFIVLAGFVACWRTLPNPEDTAGLLESDIGAFGKIREIIESFLRLWRSLNPRVKSDTSYEVWKASLNRETTISLFESRAAIKGDAAQNVCKISTARLAWAVIDGGIDATHRAFLDRDSKKPLPAVGAPIMAGQSRVRKTLDLTFLRTLLALQTNTYVTGSGRTVTLTAKQQAELVDFRKRVKLGREIDWEMLLPLIEVPHDA